MKKRTSILLLGALVIEPGTQACLAAENISLKRGISFNQDIDSGFPIVGQKMDDASIEPGKPTFIFFGGSGDLNTNRQAKIVVGLYNKYAKEGVKFLLVDVDKTNKTPAVTQLIKKYYKGYIPSQVILNADGGVVDSKIGEVAEGSLSRPLSIAASSTSTKGSTLAAPSRNKIDLDNTKNSDSENSDNADQSDVNSDTQSLIKDAAR
ncbi:MAG: hypothetical protein IPG59_18275 [Candidatus Melainabacteria bacterium]|nr:MAG: hypothetical protein IPG59_18275 [Candidatus Melainabacteria bacterium]